MKKWLYPVISILIIGFAGVAVQSAAQASDETIPEVEIQKLSSHTGKYITVLYAVGNQPMFSTDDHDIRIRTVRLSRTSGPITSDSRTIDSVKLPRLGFGGSFNYVMVVIHEQPQFYWRNADGSVPTYPEDIQTKNDDSFYLTVDVKAFNRKQIPSLSGRNSSNVSTKVVLIMPN